MKYKILILSLIFAFQGTVALGAIWHVDGELPGSGNGTSWSEAFTSIQEAVDASSQAGGDEIWVKMGTYSLSGTITVNKPVSIYGGFAGSENQREQRDWENNQTYIDGQDTIRCFLITSNSTIDGFTITRGYYFSDDTVGGSGMYVDQSTIIINNCVFYRNYTEFAARGGAIYINESMTNISSTKFIGNVGGSGGAGIYCWMSHMTINECLFQSNRNRDNDGGGLSNVYSSVSIINSKFSKNYTEEFGGGVYNSGSEVEIIGCQFEENIADRGGGIANIGSSVNVSNSVFNSNEVYLGGGGIYNGSSSLDVSKSYFTGNFSRSSGGAMQNRESSSTITNCIFVSNTADYAGGAIVNEDSSGYIIITNCNFWDNRLTRVDYSYGGAIYNVYNSEVVLTNSILWNDYAIEGKEIYSENGTVLVTYSDVEGGYVGDGNIQNDPLFVDPGQSDFHLQPGSPCIDNGTQQGAPTDDIDGDARPQGLGVDIGVDEYVYTIKDILAFFDQSIINKKLYGMGPGKSAVNRLNAFRNMLVSLENLTSTGEIDKACGRISAISNKCDGQSPPPDFVNGEATQNLSNLIKELALNFGCN